MYTKKGTYISKILKAGNHKIQIPVDKKLVWFYANDKKHLLSDLFLIFLEASVKILPLIAVLLINYWLGFWAGIGFIAGAWVAYLIIEYKEFHEMKKIPE